MADFLIIAVVAIALIFDFVNGFHDAANSIATVVATRVLKPWQAVLWAAFFNFAAFLVSTPQGLILIDTMDHEWVPKLRKNITDLGFKVSDIKILLQAHAQGLEFSNGVFGPHHRADLGQLGFHHRPCQSPACLRRMYLHQKPCDDD